MHLFMGAMNLIPYRLFLSLHCQESAGVILQDVETGRKKAIGVGLALQILTSLVSNFNYLSYSHKRIGHPASSGQIPHGRRLKCTLSAWDFVLCVKPSAAAISKWDHTLLKQTQVLPSLYPKGDFPGEDGMLTLRGLVHWQVGGSWFSAWSLGVHIGSPVWVLQLFDYGCHPMLAPRGSLFSF